MRVIRFFTIAFLMMFAGVVHAQFVSVFTGTTSAVTTRQFTGVWSATPPAIELAGPYVYVVARDDGASLDGVLADVAKGKWEVCPPTPRR